MTSRLSEVWPAVSRAARNLGVIEIGASDLEDSHHDVFSKWLDSGHEASMGWLRKNREARLDPRTRFPWARSVVALLIPYSPERPQRDDFIATRIARYALGDDYHDVVGRILIEIENVIREEAPDTTTRRYVDTGPLSDRAFAVQAGLGWIGRNAMVIHPSHGSWTFIGVVLTSLENDLDTSEITDMCGACNLCVEACPTEAILEDRTVDSNRCISYLTIEHRGELPVEFQDRLDGNLFGCDVCQEVCPWNESPPGSLPELEPRVEYSRRPISSLLEITQPEFSAVFRKSAVKRAKHAGMVRNATLISPRH